MFIKECKILSRKNIWYVSAKDLMIHFPEFFINCRDNSRNIIGRKNIPDDEYMWVETTEIKHRLSNRKCKQAVLYISKEWVDDHIVGFSDEKNIIKPTDLLKIPPKLILKDNEKWTDADGKTYEIGTVGERSIDGIFFNASDISELFDMKHLETTIVNKNTEYMPGIHYRYFVLQKTEQLQKMTIEIGDAKNKKTGSKKDKKIVKVLYLTYFGLVRVLFVSHNKRVEEFQRWVLDILFTHQFGSVAEKRALASKLIGVEPSVINIFLDTSIKTVPCVYLFSIGTVKDLRKSLKIPETYNDTDLVFKYGFTKDLQRRTNEHKANYGELKGANLQLIYFSYVDTKFLSNAENVIRDFVTPYKLNHKTYNELIVSNKKTMETKLKGFYESVFSMYGGSYAELVNKIVENEHISDKKLLAHQNETITQIANMKFDYVSNVTKLEAELALARKDLEVANISHQKELEMLKNNHREELLSAKKELEMSNINHQQELSSAKKELEMSNINHQQELILAKKELELLQAKHEIEIIKKKYDNRCKK